MCWWVGFGVRMFGVATRHAEGGMIKFVADEGSEDRFDLAADFSNDTDSMPSQRRGILPGNGPADQHAHAVVGHGQSPAARIFPIELHLDASGHEPVGTIDEDEIAGDIEDRTDSTLPLGDGDSHGCRAKACSVPWPAEYMQLKSCKAFMF